MYTASSVAIMAKLALIHASATSVANRDNIGLSFPFKSNLSWEICLIR